MKCQILFSGKSTKNITNLSSAESFTQCLKRLLNLHYRIYPKFGVPCENKEPIKLSSFVKMLRKSVEKIRNLLGSKKSCRGSNNFVNDVMTT